MLYKREKCEKMKLYLGAINLRVNQIRIGNYRSVFLTDIVRNAFKTDTR